MPTSGCRVALQAASRVSIKTGKAHSRRGHNKGLSGTVQEVHRMVSGLRNCTGVQSRQAQLADVLPCSTGTAWLTRRPGLHS